MMMMMMKPPLSVVATRRHICFAFPTDSVAGNETVDIFLFITRAIVIPIAMIATTLITHQKSDILSLITPMVKTTARERMT